MESLTLELEPPIATGATADIHDWRNGQVLKLYRDFVPRASAVREARITRALHDAGVRVPAVGELLEVNGRLGLPMDTRTADNLQTPVVIDCVVAHRGNPLADVAQMRVAMTEWLYIGLPEAGRRAVERFIDSYEKRYFELLPGGRDEVAAWMPVVAAVRISLGHAPSSEEPLQGIIDAGLK
jgi:hypothetical protein